MLNINSARSETYIKQGSSQKVETSANLTSETQSNKQGDSTTARSDITLSDRALKVQKLNEEFFSRGTGQFSITPQFIGRLAEYGLISQVEASQLRPLMGLSEQLSEAEQEGTPLKELRSFVKEYSEKLEDEEEPNNQLIDLLAKADQVLENFDHSQPAPSDLSPRSIALELNQFNRSDAAETLSDDEKKSMRQLELAMRLSDRLNPQTLTAGRVNSYLNALSRFA